MATKKKPCSAGGIAMADTASITGSTNATGSGLAAGATGQPDSGESGGNRVGGLATGATKPRLSSQPTPLDAALAGPTTEERLRGDAPATNGQAEGYFSDTGESMKAGWRELKADWRQTSSYKDQSLASTVFQQTGNVVDFAFDVVGSLISNDQTKAWAGEAADAITGTDAWKAAMARSEAVLAAAGDWLDANPAVKQALQQAAKAGVEITQEMVAEVKQWADAHPEAARNLGATGEILQIIPVGKAASLAGRAGGSMVRESVDVARRIEIEARPGTLGSNGGNIRIGLRPKEPIVPDNALTPTRPSGDPLDPPTGSRNTIEPNAPWDDVKRGIRLENESAAYLARHGYRVHQDPVGTGLLTPKQLDALGLDPKKKPDLLIEGRVFDVYAPKGDKLSGLRDGMAEKTAYNQAHRLVVNLADSPFSYHEVRNYLLEHPADNLREAIIIGRDGIIHHFLPNRR